MKVKVDKLVLTTTTKYVCMGEGGYALLPHVEGFSFISNFITVHKVTLLYMQ